MILESVLWLVSTPVDTCWPLMKDERKRMKALGGRGIWSSGRFLLWVGRRDEHSPVGVGKSTGSNVVSMAEGGSLKVTGVTLGAKAML